MNRIRIDEVWVPEHRFKPADFRRGNSDELEPGDRREAPFLQHTLINYSFFGVFILTILTFQSFSAPCHVCPSQFCFRILCFVLSISLKTRGQGSAQVLRADQPVPGDHPAVHQLHRQPRVPLHANAIRVPLQVEHEHGLAILAITITDAIILKGICPPSSAACSR